jgi:hypothetical protein
MSKATNEARIAPPLLILLASGGTLESAIADLPDCRVRIEAAFEWMKSNARCTSAEVAHLADRLREVVLKKDHAIRYQDFALAADLHAEECALFQSLGLGKPTGGVWQTVLHVGVEEQMQRLAALLREMQSTEA